MIYIRSSEILNLSHDSLRLIRRENPGVTFPNFIEELSKFARCVYYIERHATENELIFETNNKYRWENSKEYINHILNVLMRTPTVFTKNISLIFEAIDNIREPTELRDNTEKFFANSLFSGGVDSICGANHWVAKDKKKIVFSHITHKNTPSIKMIRNYIKNELKMPLIELDGHFFDDANFRTISKGNKNTEMHLNQTRTFFYLCNAISVNYLLGIDKIFIAENGPLTINPPFTLSHTFTNTTNPEFISLFNGFLYEYFDGKDLISAKLPFRNLTKAELMAKVPSDILIRTHSCSRQPNKKESCFNCYACYIRRFSAYAYGNFQDDIYNPKYYDPDEEGYERYNIKEEKNHFNKEPSFFEGRASRNLIIELLDFCFKTIERDTGITEEEKLSSKINFSNLYSSVTSKCREVSEHYEDIWDLLNRFSEEIIAGIYQYFNKNPIYKNVNYNIYNYFLKETERLISKGKLKSNYFDITRERIRNRGIRADIRE